jgi:hypothetical protein
VAPIVLLFLHKWIVITTNGTYLLSFVTQILGSVASMGAKTLYQGNHEYEPQTLEYLTN